MRMLEIASFVVGAASLILGLAGCPESWGVLAMILEFEWMRIALGVIGLSGLGYWASRLSYKKPPIVEVDGLGAGYSVRVEQNLVSIKRLTD
ncbi:hypothetical protein BSQ44_24185 [Aquibium oceanicum]|uniref:Uncharacterized protein n=1 Tax=Aquibium oceanicum TaxID=1670800 RepID=A0A1L3SXL1_9HYPH|nr:hypothetical protein BSQ44_24185 [Aquibium oceanicum]